MTPEEYKKAKQAAYWQKWYAKNKDRLAEKRKKNYAENREKIAAQVKEWRHTHPDKVREANRRYREKHPDRANSYARIKRELNDCRNELCLRCGDYKMRHKGACEGCRWYEPPKEET